MTKDQALSLLSRSDLSREEIEELACDPETLKSRRVLCALVGHSHTPRHISLPRARHLYTFELMQVALTPAVPADVRLFIEELLLNRLPTITAGERLTLAKRASGRVAAALLRDSDTRVMQTALENPRITEAAVVRALHGAEAPLVHALCRHAEWSRRKEVQIALLRNPHTPATRAAYFAGELATAMLRELAPYVSGEVRVQIERELQQREQKAEP